MWNMSLDHMQGPPLAAAIIVAVAVLLLVGFSFGFQGNVQF